MGLLSIIKKQKLKDKELRILILGLDNAGKTTIVKKIINEDVSKVSPTMGFQISTVLYKEYNLNIWDIGGQTSLRAFWGNYFDKTDAIMWVIDGLALERLNESFKELKEKILLQDRLVGIKVLILVNKVDLLDDYEEVEREVSSLLNVDEKIPANQQWKVLSISGKTGFGIIEALEWCIS
ncbi:ADP-ribosylation factor [[Candida] jaroonii]|uniref:ADP-ribosylation factor n=1 Tax=[Candida] jaroonii TaxID=467808 RepID=A0ACA9YAK5_9ASCO|nr:ADP-ribosylation factor [[Candida] jaroonii]